MKSIKVLIVRTFINRRLWVQKQWSGYLVLIAISFLFLITGCRAKKPNVQDIAGIYLPTAATTIIFAKMGYSTNVSPALTLSADSSFMVNQMPDASFNGSRSHFYGKPVANPEYDSGQGRWNLIPGDEGLGWYIELLFTNTDNFSKGSAPRRPSSPNLTTRELAVVQQLNEKQILFFGIGDPDSGEGFGFQRTKAWVNK